MTGYCRLLLVLVFLLGSITHGRSTDTGRSMSSEIQDAVKTILGKIVNNPLVNPAFNLDNVVINVTSGGTKLEGFIDGTITGIAETKLTKNKFSLIGMKHNVVLKMPKLVLSSDYELNGVLAGVLNIHGGGPLLLELEGIVGNIVVYVDAKSRLPTLYLKNVTAELSLEKFHLQIDNILGELSDAFNDMVNAIAPEVFTVYQPQIESLVADLIFDLINGLLSGGGGGAEGEVDVALGGAEGEVDVAQVIARFAWGEVDSSRVNAAVGKIINHAITMAIENMAL